MRRSGQSKASNTSRETLVSEPSCPLTQIYWDPRGFEDPLVIVLDPETSIVEIAFGCQPKVRYNDAWSTHTQ